MLRRDRYYEDCAPNPKEPTTIKILGQDFDVLPTAMESLSKFKPGDQMTVLLTEGGQVAGAVAATGTDARGNAVGIVSDSGAVQMLCGTATIQISGGDAGGLKGQLVRISSTTVSYTHLEPQSCRDSDQLVCFEKPSPEWETVFVATKNSRNHLPR